MLDFVPTFILAYKEVIGIALIGMLTLLVVKRYWDSVGFWLMDFWYGFPVIGKVNRLSKNLELESTSNWFHSEKVLAAAYKNHYNKVTANPAYYNKCKSYIDLANETGRSPFRWYMWVLVFLMVAIEAMGFSYVLAGFTIPGASENVLKMGAVGISFLISVLLVGFTHLSGKELYTNSLMHAAREWWKADTSDKKPKKLIASGTFGIERDDQDSNDPNYIRLLRRVSNTGEAKRRYLVTTWTAVFVVIIAIGATYVRGVVLERELQYETLNGTGHVGNGSSQPFFPPAIAGPQAKADNKAIEDGVNLDRQGGWGTFIILAVLFVFMQIFGVLSGYKYGFVGKESARADKATRGFDTQEDYVAWHKRKSDSVVDAAQRRLTDLQSRISNIVEKSSNSNELEAAVKAAGDRDMRSYLADQASINRKYEDENYRPVQKQKVKCAQIDDFTAATALLAADMLIENKSAQ